MKVRITAAAATVVAMGALAGPASAQVPPPPNCEHGQTQAATNAAKKLKVDQVAKHTLKAAACLAGQPPRNPSLPNL